MNIFKQLIIKLFNQKTKVLFAGFIVLEKDGFVVEVLRGDISVSNMKAYKLYQANHPSFRPTYTIVSDERKCRFEGLIFEVDEYVKFLESQVHKITDQRKVISLVRTNNQKRFLTLYKNRHQRLLQELQLFTSVEDGLDWIGHLEMTNKVKDAIEIVSKELKSYT